MYALALNLLCSLLLTGAVWFFQMVHLPGFDEVGKKQFRLYMREHLMNLMTFALPLMIVEGVASLWLIVAMPSIEATIGLVATIGVWVTLGMLHLPEYRALAIDKDRKALKKLNFANWVLTAVWSVRSLALLSILVLR